MSSQKDLVNLQAQQLALQAAQAAAQQEFLRMRFQQLELPQFQHMSDMDKERLAFDKSTETFNETMKMIQLTGKLPNGQLTQEAALQRAQVTGLLDGEETLAAKTLRAQMSGFYEGEMTTTEQQRLFGNQVTQAGLTGQFNGQETTAEQQRQFQNLISEAQQTGMYKGQETIDWAAKQAGITGYFNGAPTLARQGQEEQTALGLANIGKDLSGPADIFKFLRTFAGTPNGMMDLLNATAGRYQLPGFTGGSMQGNPNYAPSTVSSLISQMVGAGNGGGVQGNPQGNPNLWDVASTPYAPPYGSIALPANNPGGPPFTPATQPIAQPVVQPVIHPAQIAAATTDPLTSTSQNVANIVNGVSALNDSRQTKPPITPHPPGTPAPTNQYNYQDMGDGRYYTYPPGLDAPVDAHQYSSSTPLSYSDLNNFAKMGTNEGGIDPNIQHVGNPDVWGGQTAIPKQPSDYDTYLSNLVAPSKINAENWGNLSTFQKQATESAYGEKGYTPQNFEEMFKKSLPRYAGPAVGSFV